MTNIKLNFSIYLEPYVLRNYSMNDNFVGVTKKGNDNTFK